MEENVNSNEQEEYWDNLFEQECEKRRKKYSLEQALRIKYENEDILETAKIFYDYIGDDKMKEESKRYSLDQALRIHYNTVEDILETAKMFYEYIKN